MSSDTTRAGHACIASRPPLIADRCLRTVFISAIVAPRSSSACVIACFCASEMPCAGRAHSAEPPPEISAITRSSGPSPVTARINRWPAATLRSSGTGCRPSMSSMRSSGNEAPGGTTTTPPSGPRQCCSTARAIAAAALPIPTTTVRPRGGSGR